MARPEGWTYAGHPGERQDVRAARTRFQRMPVDHKVPLLPEQTLLGERQQPVSWPCRLVTPDPGSLASAGRATLLLTGGAVLVQAIGFIRQVFLAAEVGIAGSLDAFLIAVALPEALVAVLTGGVTVALVPAYSQVKDDLGLSAARRLAGTVLVWLGLSGIALSICLWAFADDFVALTAPGLAVAATDDAVRFLRTLAPLTALSSITAVLFAACQAERLFPAMTSSASRVRSWRWRSRSTSGTAMASMGSS